MADTEVDMGGVGGANGGTSIPDFVRKLFRMLDDPASTDVVEWADDGLSFIVKDTNEFSKDVLPRHFKHNNFASFVRQLNKYDFHKIKTSPDAPKRYGELAWEFKHPDFSLHNIDQLSNIKRKSPTTKKGKESTGSESSLVVGSSIPKELAACAPETVSVAPSEMGSYLQTLSANYEAVVRDLLVVKRNMAVQDQLMQQLLQYLINRESDASRSLPADVTNTLAVNSQGISALMRPNDSAASSRLLTPLIPSHAPAQNVSPPQLGTGSVPLSIPASPPPSFNMPAHMWSPSDIPSFAATTPMDSFSNMSFPILSETSTSAMEEVSRRFANTSDPNNLTVTTLGMLRKREGPSPPPSGNGTMRVVRQTFVPSWSVPPKVLLVEDDATCRMVASKLLQIAGCTFEIAHDGIEAVTKMNVDKYDIVLMDILMPNMDGLSATSQIRQFDMATPVISMTSNTSRDDCLRYLNNGMNDVLGKPFSRDHLIAMIQRYCSHLGLFREDVGVADITEDEPTMPSMKRIKTDM